MKKIFLSSILALFFHFAGKSQALSYTVDAYIDNNNNLIHDGGEPYLTNGYNILPVHELTSCGSNWGNGTFYGNCPGGLFGGTLGNVTVCNAGNYITYVYDLGAYLQPIPGVINGALTGNTSSVSNVPIKSAILNQAFMTNISCGYKNTAAPFPSAYSDMLAGMIDTASGGPGYLCSNANLDIETNIFMMFNLVNCANLKTNMNVKIDNTIIDTYNFIGGASNNYSTVTLTNGKIQNWYAAVAPYMASFSYSLTNYTMPSPGYHTLTIESVPVSMSYTGTTLMRSVFYVTDCGQVNGNAYVDCNSNCSKDFSEYYPYYNIAGLQLAGATNTITASPDLTGNYAVNIPVGNYTATPSVIGGYSLCSSAPFTVSVTSSSTFTYDLAIKEITAPVTDYSSTYMVSGANPGPGAVPGGTININVYNSTIHSGCVAWMNPTKLKVVLPPLMSFGNVLGTTTPVSAIIPAATGDTIIWNNPGAIGMHQFSAVTATSAVIGSGYCIKSIIEPLSDANSINNTYSLCRNYGGPFDPNEKTSENPNMMSNGNIPPGTTDLIYTIRFQNVGSGSAVNIEIKDTIDVNLDINSIQILSSSFPVQTQINSNREVDFRFNGIMLPASSVNELASHGYVQYKINLLPGLPLGTSIKNRAHNYFDYNSGISTNQTSNLIATPLKVNENELEKTVQLYPNPTNGYVTINSNNNINKIEVLNAIGQIALSKNAGEAHNTTIDLGELQPGVYVIRLFTSNGTINKKIIRN